MLSDLISDRCFQWQKWLEARRSEKTLDELIARIAATKGLNSFEKDYLYRLVRRWERPRVRLLDKRRNRPRLKGLSWDQIMGVDK